MGMGMLKAIPAHLYSISDHTPVSFNVFEDWNDESVVPHICFDSIRIRFERKRPIRRSVDDV